MQIWKWPHRRWNVVISERTFIIRGKILILQQINRATTKAFPVNLGTRMSITSTSIQNYIETPQPEKPRKKKKKRNKTQFHNEETWALRPVCRDGCLRCCTGWFTTNWAASPLNTKVCFQRYKGKSLKNHHSLSAYLVCASVLVTWPTFPFYHCPEGSWGALAVPQPGCGREGSVNFQGFSTTDISNHRAKCCEKGFHRWISWG